MPLSLRLSKPWRPLDEKEVARLGGHLGIYQIGDADGRVLKIGHAGGRSLFGLQGELRRELAAAGTAPRRFRVEVTTQYLTRWRELLMLHRFEHGGFPPGNADLDPARFGRLSPR